MKTIAVAGGSGYTGKRLLPLLDQEKVRVLLRPGTAASEEWRDDARVVGVDCMSADALERELVGVDEIVCLVGTTRARFEEGISYESVDYGIPAALAEAGRRTGVKKLHLLSSVGANLKAMSSYFRWKGKAEQVVRESGLTWTITRPGPIVGAGRRVLQVSDLFAVPASFIPGVSGLGRRMRSIDAGDLARVFVRLVRTDEHDNQILEGKLLHEVAGKATG